MIKNDLIGVDDIGGDIEMLNGDLKEELIEDISWGLMRTIREGVKESLIKRIIKEII